MAEVTESEGRRIAAASLIKALDEIDRDHPDLAHVRFHVSDALTWLGIHRSAGEMFDALESRDG